MSNITPHAIRLLPGQDLKLEIQKYVETMQIKAGWISACVGSLSAYNIRFADMSAGSVANMKCEILTLSGTVSINGSHLHICVADSNGKAVGGHLLTGCVIYTTAEIVILSTGSYEFKRQNDGSTPWKELLIQGHTD